MKREGRQHGMVRSFRILPSSINPRPNTRFITRFDSPPTAGLFTKVPSKPTNHSKFTGKCGTPRCYGCHFHPVCKSKNKSKGTQKHKNGWFKDRPDSDFSGLSATGTLYYLSKRNLVDEVEDESGDQVDYHVNLSCTSKDDDLVNQDDFSKRISEIELSFTVEQDEEKYEDEDWCLVESCS